MISASPLIWKGPWASTTRMPSSLTLPVTRAEKNPTQIGGQHVRRQIARDRQSLHGFMGDRKRLLISVIDLEQPVEMNGVIVVVAVAARRFDAA